MDQVNGGKLSPRGGRAGHEHTLDDLANAGTTGAVEGDVLYFTGDAWVPGPGVPTGTIIASGSAIPPSDLWLPCAGTVVSRTTYSDLFDAIGVLYGNGDRHTTFGLPSLASATLGGVFMHWYIRV